MCWMCDRPEATFDDYVDTVVQPMIDRFGWAVQAVEADRDHPPFSYTVGLTPRGLPELVITGKTPLESLEVLNASARELQLGKPPDPGSLVRVDEGWFEVVRVTRPEAHLFVATALYDDVRALQLVWPDAHARWPWDRAYRRGRSGQPVLGQRVPRAA